MNSNHSSIEWTFGNGEKVSFTIPDERSDGESGAPWVDIYYELRKESRRRIRINAIQTWIYRALVSSMLIAWWVMVFLYGNSYCK